MSRRKKRPHGMKKDRPKAKRTPTEAELDEALVQDTAAVFSCAFETAADFLRQCQKDLDELDTGLTFGRLALEIWAGHPGAPESLVAVLRDYLDVRRRLLDDLTAIERRLEALTAGEVHMHIDPIEPLRDLVRKRLFPPPADT